MTKHTPEPWATEYRKDSRGMYHQDIFDANGETIAVMSWYPVMVSETRTETNREANASRIVACVNACAGMDDPQVAISRYAYERDLAKQERDKSDARIAELEAELKADRDKVSQSVDHIDALIRTVNWLHERLGYLPEAHAEALENIDMLRIALSDLIDMCETEFEMQKPICDFELMVLPAAREAIEVTEPKDTAKN